jgi:Domain of unknown function (DUF5664)
MLQEKRDHTKENLPKYTGIPYPVMERVGNVLRKGNMKYANNVFIDKWEDFEEDDAYECFDHALRHTYAAMEEIRLGITIGEEDHLASAVCNLIFLIGSTEQGKLFNAFYDKTENSEFPADSKSTATSAPENKRIDKQVTFTPESVGTFVAENTPSPQENISNKDKILNLFRSK